MLKQLGQFSCDLPEREDSVLIGFSCHHFIKRHIDFAIVLQDVANSLLKDQR